MKVVSKENLQTYTEMLIEKIGDKVPYVTYDDIQNMWNSSSDGGDTPGDDFEDEIEVNYIIKYTNKNSVNRSIFVDNNYNHQIGDDIQPEHTVDYWIQYLYETYGVDYDNTELNIDGWYVYDQDGFESYIGDDGETSIDHSPFNFKASVEYVSGNDLFDDYKVDYKIRYTDADGNVSVTDVGISGGSGPSEEFNVSIDPYDVYGSGIDLSLYDDGNVRYNDYYVDSNGNKYYWSEDGDIGYSPLTQNTTLYLDVFDNNYEGGE